MNAAITARARTLVSRTRPGPGPSPFGDALNPGESAANCKERGDATGPSYRRLQRVTHGVTVILQRNHWLKRRVTELRSGASCAHAHARACEVCCVTV